MSDPGGTTRPSGSTMGWATSPRTGWRGSSVQGMPIEIIGADRRPCPVCGHPTGDCVGSHPGVAASVRFEQKAEPVEATFTVDRRIYEEHVVGKRTVRRLLHAPGDRITPAAARRLGLLPPLDSSVRGSDGTSP